MNFNDLIPKQLLSRRNVTIQILFTAIFAFFFIIVYQPFGSRQWYKVSQVEFISYSALIVISGMLIVIFCRSMLMLINKKKAVHWRQYGFCIVIEILFTALLYTMYECVFLHDARPLLRLLGVAMMNTALILVIPYILVILYFTNFQKDLYNLVFKDSKNQNSQIKLYDDRHNLRYILHSSNVFYLESCDNYVAIYHVVNGQIQKDLLRSTLKNMEAQLPYSFVRCHRSVIVNMNKIALMQKVNAHLVIKLSHPQFQVITVSKTYKNRVKGFVDLA